MGKHYLSKLLEPETVAVFGATDRKGAVGNLVFKNMIEGEFSGEIRCRDQVTVLQSGTVEASIQARSLTIEGAVVGDVSATREVVIARSGRLHGDVVDLDSRVDAPGHLDQLGLSAGQLCAAAFLNPIGYVRRRLQILRSRLLDVARQERLRPVENHGVERGPQ